MLAADTYADYDGYTVYTTKRASKAPQPKWSDLTADYMLGVRLALFIMLHLWRRLATPANPVVWHACWVSCCCAGGLLILALRSTVRGAEDLPELGRQCGVHGAACDAQTGRWP
jgi:hypothetical protein